MPPRKKQDVQESFEPKCDNHPETPAAHVTDGKLHAPISLCSRCLKNNPHLQHR